MECRPEGTTRGWTRHAMSESAASVCYEILVCGLLGQELLGAFPGLNTRAHGTETVLAGAL